MTAAKTNEAPVRAHKSAQRGPAGVGVRSTAKFVRTSPYKMRVVLNLIRGQKVADAADILRLCERDAAITIGKVLKAAVANAVNNDEIPAEELYVSACYADEGPTIKRFRPRARGRTGRILKRTSHITVIVSRLPTDLLSQARTRSAEQVAQRAARTAASRATAEQQTADTRRAGSGTTESVAGAVIEADVVEAQAVVEAPALDADTSVNTLVGDTVVTEPAVADSPADKLNQIIGIGPALELELNAAGISTFSQLAELSDDEVEALDAKVTRSADQIKEWRLQAQQILDGTWVDTSTKNT